MIDIEQYKTIGELKVYLKNEYHLDNAGVSRWIKDHLKKESYFQEKIMNYLKDKYPDGVVKKYPAGQYSQGGMPDVTFIYKGRYYGFEVKRPYVGQVSKLQEETIKQLRKAGAVAEVVTYVNDVKRVLKEAGVET